MKKKSILTVLLVIITMVSMGQGKSTSIGLIGSSYGLYDPYNDIFGISFGLGLKHQFREKIFIKTGLLYATHKYPHSWILENYNDPVLPLQTNLTLSYLSVPIMFGYQFLNTRKWKFSASSGFDIEYQLNETEKSTYGNGSERKSEIFNQNLIKLQAIFKIALGFEYRIGDKLHLEIEPFIGKGGFELHNELLNSNKIFFGYSLGLYCKF